MDNLLDLTGTPPDQTLTAIIDAFEKLSAEESVLVKSDGDFSAIMTEFQNQFWGKFDWRPRSVKEGDWSGYIVATSKPLTGIFPLMESHHKHCDTMYVNAENTLSGGDENEGKVLMEAFFWNMEMHFTREEKVLFPAFEDRTGMVQGPTQVMRTEHEQIRGVLAQIAQSLEAGDYQSIFDQSETMLILIQQHNSKEESILYPMIDQHLSDEVERLGKQIQLLVI